MRALPALAAFVFISSFLGLSGRFFFVDPLGAFAFMGGVWADSLLADVVFTVGTLGAAFSCWHLAREHPVWSAIVGALAHWLVYVVSFLLLDETRAGAPGVLAEAVWFVTSWGAIGLAFCAITPPLARRWWTRRDSALQPAALADETP